MGGGTGEENRWKASVPVGCAVQEKGKAALHCPCFGGVKKKVREVGTGGKEISRAVKDNYILLMIV